MQNTGSKIVFKKIKVEMLDQNKKIILEDNFNGGLEIDKQKSSFIAETVGNSAGYCHEKTFYKLSHDILRIVKQTKTSDCYMSMEDAGEFSKIKTITVYENKDLR